MKKIRICHFTNHITGRSDGVYTHLMMLFKYLDKSTYEQFLVFQGDEKIENEVQALGVKVIVIPTIDNKFPINCLIQFLRFVKFYKIDIIQAHYLKPYIIGAIANIVLRKKMIFNYHGLFINNLYNNYFEKLAYRFFHSLSVLLGSVNLALAESLANKENLLRETKSFPEIRVYYNGFDPDMGDTIDINIVNHLTKLKEIYFIVGIIARIEIQKRIDISLNIAKTVVSKFPKTFFIYFGDGPDLYNMKKKIQALGLGKNVEFMDYIPGAKAYIKFFDILLFTSDWEGLPLSLWEAMANGVPIASTDVGGIKEIVEGEKCGIIFPKSSINEGAAVIEEFILNKELKSNLGKNGFEAIRNKYTLSAFIKTMETIYLDI